MHILRCLGLVGALLLFPSRGIAQTSEQDPYDALHVSIITMGPGDEAWEKFGHIAIRLQNPTTGEDDAVNWGLFDFEQKGFFLNFVQGRMRYGTGIDPGQLMVDAYSKVGRAVYEQELNLTSAQKAILVKHCKVALTPPNDQYLYDYYRNNCSSRVRDVIDAAVGGELRRQTQSIHTGTTYRWHTRRLTADDLPLYIALQTFLGHFADRPLSRWDEMFLPTYVRQSLEKLTLPGSGSANAAMVKSQQILSAGSKPAERLVPPNRVPMLLGIGLVVGMVLGVLGYFASRAGAGLPSRIAFVVVSTVWMLLIGVGGAIIFWALFTDHVAGYYNENMFFVTPLALAQVWWLPRSRRGGASARRALSVSGAMLALALLGIAVKALPAFYQYNADIIAMTLPPTAAAVVVAWLGWRSQRATVLASA